MPTAEKQPAKELMKIATTQTKLAGLQVSDSACWRAEVLEIPPKA